MERVVNVDNVEEVDNDDPMEMINEVDTDEEEVINNNIGMPFEMHSRVSDVSRQREHRLRELMRYLVHTHNCRDIIRMGPQAFLQLCQKLRVPESVSRHFHNVLHAILSLGGEFLVQSSGMDVPPQILNDSRFYPYFKDCIGAIDATHIRVKVPTAEAPRFRGRKKYPTQNVFAACDFDMKFTYVLARWEGSASDSRILKDALSREDPLKIPEGKFYIGDAGFMPKHGILTPYRGVPYHLKEYSARSP